MKKYELIAKQSILHDESCKLKVVLDVLYPKGKDLEIDVQYGCCCIVAEIVETLENLFESGEETQEMQEIPMNETTTSLHVVGSSNGNRQKVSQGVQA